MTDDKRGVVIKWIFGEDPAVAEEGCGLPPRQATTRLLGLEEFNRAGKVKQPSR
jgi:hypothetical protein